jgi:hypothetical protein
LHENTGGETDSTVPVRDILVAFIVEEIRNAGEIEGFACFTRLMTDRRRRHEHVFSGRAPASSDHPAMTM